MSRRPLKLNNIECKLSLLYRNVQIKYVIQGKTRFLMISCNPQIEPIVLHTHGCTFDLIMSSVSTQCDYQLYTVTSNILSLLFFQEQYFHKLYIIFMASFRGLSSSERALGQLMGVASERPLHETSDQQEDSGRM